MPHIVAGAVKDYDWGIVDGLARWNGPTGAPQAELWFGTHPSGPTPVVTGPDAGLLLADLVEHRGMPLVKLLAAGTPLSIQVHPDGALASQGWASGSPLYADDAEKAEMLVAIEPFDIHAGWRDPDDAAGLFADAGAPADVVDVVRAGDPVASVRRVLDVDPHERAALAARLVDAASRRGWSPEAVRALERVIASFPGDPGVLVSVLLEHDVLQPGEAIAVSAGIVHSYVAGLGIEVMTSSDNVLRLGLTSKPIAVDEALDAVSRDRVPQRLSASPDEPLAPPGMPFDLLVSAAPCSLPQGRHRLVLALEGDVRITGGPGAGEVVGEGRAAVWAPTEADAVIEPAGRAVIVTGD
ncbi:MAG: mannose-6-phosphate isomerase, class [Actinomycetota bacterium]